MFKENEVNEKLKAVILAIQKGVENYSYSTAFPKRILIS